MSRPRLALAALTLAAAACGAPQAPTTTSPRPSQSPTIDEEVARLFSRPFPEGELPSGFLFSPDGRRLLYFRVIGDERSVSRQLWVHDLESGRASPISGAAADLPIAGLSWFPDGQRLLAVANGGLYVVTLDGATPRRLAGEASSPRISPDGRRVAFLRRHDLWLVDVASGAERRLTTDGSDTRLNGEIDWVYEEELELYQGFWWSPDSRRLAFVQFDESAVTAYPVRLPGQPTPVVIQQRYPQAGETNPTVRLGLLDLDGEGTPTPRWIDLAAPPGEETLLARVGWLPDGGRLWTITLDRLQRVLRLSTHDPEGAAPPATLVEERDELWLNLLDEPVFLGDGERFLWRSERDGHAHLYVHDLEGGEPLRLTRGAWQVSDVVDVDEEAGRVRFVGNRERPATYQLYETSLTAAEEPRRLTGTDGCHHVEFSPDHRHFVDVHSSLSRPPRAELMRADGTRVATLAEEDLRELPHLDEVHASVFDVPGPGDVTYQARMFRPAQLEKGQRYPVLVWVYNGPGAQVVRDQWRTKYVPWMHLLARRGVIVFSLDGRGSHGRGRDWEKPIYRRLTEVELEDQMRGVEYLRGLDYVDPNRIGVFGWSYGGTMVLAALLRHPGELAMGVSVAPVSDWRYYDTIYTERYMMRPRDNPEGYARSALWPIADRLEDPLLLIHGLSDDNVHFRNSERMVEAFVEAGRRFDLMVYPGQAHGIAAPASRRHVFSTITAYVMDHLLDR